MKNLIRIISILLFILLAIQKLSYSDEVFLKNGNKFEGNILSFNDDTLNFAIVIDGKPANCIIQLQSSEILRIIDDDKYSNIIFHKLSPNEKSIFNKIELARQGKILKWYNDKIAHERNLEIEEIKFKTILEKESLLASLNKPSVNVNVDIDNSISTSSFSQVGFKHNKKE